MSMNIGGCGSYGTGQTQQSQKSGGLQDLMQALFNQADGDGSGSINSDEFTALMGHTNGMGASSAVNTSDLFKSIDTDGDGQISLNEFKKFAAGGLFSSQVGAASGNSGSSSTFGISGMLGKMTQAAENLFENVFGDGSSLPPGTTVSASVFAAISQDGQTAWVGASVSETTTCTLTEAATGKVVASSCALQLATALSRYHSHHHHHGGAGGLAQLFGQMDGNADGSVSTDELTAFINGTPGSAGGSATA